MAQTLTKTQAAILEGVASFHQALAQGLKLDFGTIAFGSYATGGVSITFGSMNTVIMAQISPFGGYVFNYSGGKILAYQQASNVASNLSQVGAGVDLSGLTAVPYFAIGM